MKKSVNLKILNFSYVVIILITQVLEKWKYWKCSEMVFHLLSPPLIIFQILDGKFSLGPKTTPKKLIQLKSPSHNATHQTPLILNTIIWSNENTHYVHMWREANGYKLFLAILSNKPPIKLIAIIIMKFVRIFALWSFLRLNEYDVWRDRKLLMF